MARTTTQATSDAPAAVAPSASSSRVMKRRSKNTRSGRSTAASASSSSLLQSMVNQAAEVESAEAGASQSTHPTLTSGRSMAVDGMSQNTQEEARKVEFGDFGAGGSSSRNGKGKGKAKAIEQPELQVQEEWDMLDDADASAPLVNEVCPITDKDTKPFPIMELPTEIRLEIYRACLTRPYNILLSKREQPPQPEPETEADKCSLTISDSQSDADDTEEEAGARVSQRTRQQRAASSTQTDSARAPVANVACGTGPRGNRPIRLHTSRCASGAFTSNATRSVDIDNAHQNNSSVIFRPATSRPARRNISNTRTIHIPSNEPPRLQTQDPLLVNILRASKDVYKEARGVLYNENIFTLDLNTAMPTLACLHQRSRRQIKHVELEIPSYNEILERFQETVRLSLRYCSGLKKFVVSMPFTLPGADGSGTTGNTTVYANGFDILRWLPQECDIVLTGNICTEIRTVVDKHLKLAKTLDKVSRASHQYCSWPDRFDEVLEPQKNGTDEFVDTLLGDLKSNVSST